MSKRPVQRPRRRATRELKVLPFRPECLFPVCRSKARPSCSIATSRVDVPVAAASGEDRFIQHLVQISDKFLFGIFLDFDDLGALVDDRLEENLGNVVYLNLNGVDNRVEGREGIGPKSAQISVNNTSREWKNNLQDPKVWAIVDKAAHVCLRSTMIVPLVVQALPSFADDFDRGQE